MVNKVCNSQTSLVRNVLTLLLLHRVSLEPFCCYFKHQKTQAFCQQKNIVKHLHSSILSLLDKVFSALSLLLYPWNLVQFDGTKKSSNPQRAHLSRVSHWLAASAYFCRTAGLPSCVNIAASSCAQFDAFRSHRVFSAFHPLLRVYDWH